VGLQSKNAEERFERAFAGIPRDVWHVFEDPTECEGVVGRMLEGEGEGEDRQRW
jgi:hypothetical protein